MQRHLAVQTRNARRICGATTIESWWRRASQSIIGPGTWIPLPARQDVRSDTQAAMPTRRGSHRPVPSALLAKPCAFCGRHCLQPLVAFRALSVLRCRHCRSGCVATEPRRYGAPARPDDYSHRYEQERTKDKAASCWQIVRTCTAHQAKLRRVLDVGCGEGDFLDQARAGGLETFGIDVAPRAVEEATRKGHHVTCASATEMSVGAGAYDLVTLWDLLEHTPHPGLVLKKARTALAPGGRLLITTPLMDSLFDRLGRCVHVASGGEFDQLLAMCWSDDHLWRFNLAGMRGVLRELGFVSVRVRPIRLLSLRTGCYAGGEIMSSWTGWRRLDRLISRAGVGVVKALGLPNKLLAGACAPPVLSGDE